MNRRQFLTAMLGVAIVAAIALTGCDDVLAEIQGATEFAASKTELPSIEADGNGISASVGEGFTTDEDTFAAVVADMAEHSSSGYESYTLPGNGGEDYLTALNLTERSSPLDVVIDGRRNESQTGWVVTGGTNSITIWSGVSLTLTNITFTTLPFIVNAGGILVLDTGAVIQGNAGAGVTVNDGGILILNNGAAVQGNTGAGITVNGGLLEMKDGSLVTDNRDSGVVLKSNGTFTMEGGTISGNAADIGGGVVMTSGGGTFTMTGGIISGNTARSYTGGGGGVAMGRTGGGIFTMTGGTISNNTASANVGGGVMANGGEFMMDGGTISGNTANIGGGVAVFGAGNSFTMTKGTISGNSGVSNAGGGVFVAAVGVFTMNGGTISGNTATGGGGGVMVDNCVFTMNGGEITGNNAQFIGGVYLLGSNSVDANGKIRGDPSVGSKDSSKGSIYGNTAGDVHYP
jgi:hypothetical protein